MPVKICVRGHMFGVKGACSQAMMRTSIAHNGATDYRVLLRCGMTSVTGTEVGLDQAGRPQRLAMKARCSGMSLAGAAST
jgi:hypothetical protein